jgi:hypothetical protein
MQIVSTEHLAQLLIGIARAQAGSAQEPPGGALADLPVRLLREIRAGGRPDAAAIARELDRLCGADGRPTDFNP